MTNTLLYYLLDYTIDPSWKKKMGYNIDNTTDNTTINNDNNDNDDNNTNNNHNKATPTGRR